MASLRLLRLVLSRGSLVFQPRTSLRVCCRGRVDLSRTSGFHRDVVRRRLTGNCIQLYRPTSVMGYATRRTVVTDTVVTEDGGKVLDILWEDGHSSRFHSIWLRYNCQCPACKHLDSGQKTMEITDIKPDVTISKVNVTDKDVSLTWNCGHSGVIPKEFLYSNCYSKKALKRRAESVRLTEECTFKTIPTMSYQELMTSQENVLKWMVDINKYGVCLIKGVPLEEKQIIEIADLIDKPQNTIYGETFDVISTPQPINIAYSTEHIDFHMDLVYYESPPGLQLLHAIRFDPCVEGGETFILDAFRLAEDFRRYYPDHFRTLTEVPGSFQKIHYSRESPVHMTYQRPHIVVNKNNEVISMTWAPPFEGPLHVPEADVERYYAAYTEFAKAMKTSPHTVTQKLQEGDLIVFNNRRMLHGRKSFNLNGGIRRLRGCYINIDHFKSKLQVLMNTVGDGGLAKRVGNHD